MSQYYRKLSKGNFWYYKFDFSGKTYFSKAIYSTKGEAKKAENERYSEVQESHKYPNKPQFSLLQAINERLDYIQVKKSKKYYSENKYYLGILLNCIGNKDLREITKVEINDLLLNVASALKNNGQDNYKINAMIRVYKALFNQIINNHDLNLKSPLSGIKFFPINKRLKYIPSDEDIKNVKLLCNFRQNFLIDFVMETGARIGECFDVKGIDITTDYIVLYTRKSRNSNLVPRKISRPLCLNGINLIADEFLFQEWKEKPKFLSRKVNLLNQRAWNWHNLRHRYASKLSKEGKPLFEIMVLLGHSSIKTTQGYLQLLP